MSSVKKIIIEDKEGLLCTVQLDFNTGELTALTHRYAHVDYLSAAIDDAIATKWPMLCSPKTKT